MCASERATRFDRLRGFMLMEVLVALAIFSVGVVGVLAGLLRSFQAGSHAVLVDEAALIAQRQMALATTVSGDELQPTNGSSGRYKWRVGFLEKDHGLVLASVEVNWLAKGQVQQFALSQLFLPRTYPSERADVALAR